MENKWRKKINSVNYIYRFKKKIKKIFFPLYLKDLTI